MSHWSWIIIRGLNLHVPRQGEKRDFSRHRYVYNIILKKYIENNAYKTNYTVNDNGTCEENNAFNTLFGLMDAYRNVTGPVCVCVVCTPITL